jgi:hypothetical protein
MRFPLVPKLLFGNPLRETLFRPHSAKRSFWKRVPKPEFGNEGKGDVSFAARRARRPRSPEARGETLAAKRRMEV